MIALWNRREVFFTYSDNMTKVITKLLEKEGIDYIRKSQRRVMGANVVKAPDPLNPEVLIDDTYSATTYIYVHKDDVPRAKMLLEPFRKK